MSLALHISGKFLKLSPALLNSKIKCLVQRGNYAAALQLYSRSLLCATNFTFPSLFKACASLSNLRHGKTLHSTIIQLGLRFDPFVAASLISLYVKCGVLVYAANVFDGLPKSGAAAPDVTTWNSIIDGYFRYGYINEGLAHFCKMRSVGILPDAYSLCTLLSYCGEFSRYMDGKLIHGYILRCCFIGDPFLESALIGMYLSCGRVPNAWQAFCLLENNSNVVPWNVMISGFCEHGYWEWCLELYALMKDESVKFVSESFTSTLGACCHGENIEYGRQVQADVIKMGFGEDPYVCTSLLTMYGKCSLVELAERVFLDVVDRGVELWNAMISSYVSNSCASDAFYLFNDMKINRIIPDAFTFSNIMSSSSMIGSYNVGRSVHAEVTKRGIEGTVAINSSLVNMYCKCGNVDDAKFVHDKMRERDVIAWGSIITGLCQNLRFKEAVAYFKDMELEGVKPDSNVMSSVVGVCTGLEEIHLGFIIHGYITKSGFDLDVYVASSLIGMYSKFGFPDVAGNLFTNMPYKNLVAWNSMLSCYFSNGLPDESIKLFPQIGKHGLFPDSVSFTSVLAAVSAAAALHMGKIVHGYLIRCQILYDVQVDNALIDMYIKCGYLEYALFVFCKMSQRNLVTWNSMISGFGSHGQCVEAISLFDEMKMSGVKPDDVTFLSLLSSCNHSGLAEKGQNLFQSMTLEYGIQPKMEHYVNIVDLLGRVGRLTDAYNFVMHMPVEPDSSVWLSLLSACRVHHNLELGEVAAHNLLKMEPSKGSYYIQVLNLYGEAEMWEEAAKLRVLMKEKGLRKIPGCSWIELQNGVDVFFSSDSSSSRTIEIYETLHILKRDMKRKVDADEFFMSFENQIH